MLQNLHQAGEDFKDMLKEVEQVRSCRYGGRGAGVCCCCWFGSSAITISGASRSPPPPVGCLL